MAAGAVLGSGSLPFSYSDFSGGLNTYDQYNLLQDNQARDLSNVQGTTGGAIVKRPGRQTFWTLPSGNFVNSIFAPVDGTLVVGVDHTTNNLLAFTPFGSSTVTLATGLVHGPWEFVRGPVVGGQGPTYGMNGTNARQWNENVANVAATWTATDTGGTLPIGKYCIYWNNQVFVAGVNANPSRVYWSGIADPTAWNPANLNGSGFQDFDPNDGDVITGLGTVGPYLLVFKQRKTWVLINPATAQTRRLSDRIGCMAHRTIAAAPEGTYFLGGDSQIYLTNGSKITRISDKIRPTVQSLSSPFAATYYDSHYLLSGSHVATGESWTLDYDQRLQSWWKHTIGAFDWAVAPDDQAAGVLTLYIANADFLNVSKAFVPGVYTDNGNLFTWSWAGPWQSPSFYRRRRFPTTYMRKRLRQIRFTGLGTVDFSLAKGDPQFNPTPTLIEQDIFGNSQYDTRAIVYGQGVARAFSLVFSGYYNNPAELDEYVLMLTDRRDGITS